MQGSQTAGLDLPLRVVVWEDESGTVRIGYWPPVRITEDHGIDGATGVADEMTAALEVITGAAASP